MSDLSKFLTDLLSWYWWMTVVFVGVLVNLASSYLKSPLDAAISHWSQKRTARAIQRNADIHRHAEQLLNEPTLMALEIRSEIVNLLSATLLLALSAVMLVANQYILGGLNAATTIPLFIVIFLNVPPLILTVLSLQLLSRASEHGKVISTARFLKVTANPSIQRPASGAH